MERKIGEIFEHNSGWYQCIEADDNDCTGCDLEELCPYSKEIAQNTGFCSSMSRNDGKSVIFKKLEKVGEPYHNSEKKLCQQYKCYINPLVTDEIVYVFADNRAVIEIKQTKEDMEDLDKIKVRDYTKVEELNVMEEKKLNLKPFDIQKAIEGKPLCTRDGRKARIICVDAKGDYPIVALIDDTTKETNLHYTVNGRSHAYTESDYDLMMLPEKRSGWVNIVRGSDSRSYMGREIFQSKEEAENAIKGFSDKLIDTVKICWKE